MKQVLELNIGGIKCDREGCDYSDASIKVQDYPEWINKPCPNCSENLLTQADFDNVQRLLRTSNLLNSMSPEELALMGVYMPEDDEIVQMNIEMNGTGKVEFEIKD